jgi:Mrp family chromosome partitioning ATPase
MIRRHDSTDQRAVVDAGLELRFSAQPGTVFVPGSSHSIPAEVVSGLRHMLTRMVTTGQWPQTVALTSALRQEGVSTTALALSAVLNRDTTMPVCLVDTNWYWPSVPVVDSPGLAAVLDDELSLDEALIKAHNAGAADEWREGDDTRLMLLPAGRMSQGRRVIAARSPELKAILAELRTRFEYIILDVPAVLATSDAIALASLADATCLVVHQGVTPAAIAQEALAAIRHLLVAGVIRDNVRVHMPAGLAGQLTQG